jgi:hypothetical protein
MTQLFNKGLVYEAWGSKCYWVLQEYIYRNLADRYGLQIEGYSSADASRIALYNIVAEGDRLLLKPTRTLSASVNTFYQAMRNNPSAPSKDRFIELLNRKLEANLRAQLVPGGTP